MREREAVRVERLAWKRNRPELLRPVHVPLLAAEGVAAHPRLKANLVALAGDEPHFDERCRVEGFDEAVFADRFFAARIAWMRFLLHQRAPIPDQMVAPGSRLRRRPSV